MSKKVAGIIIAVVALLALGGIYAANKPSNESSSGESSQGASGHDGMTSSQTVEPDESTSADEVLSGTVEMDIAGSAYQKPDITVKKGTTVVWTNQDSIQHDVTPDEESDAFTGSELLSRGQSYNFTFDTVGTFTYHCTPHPFMTGSVTVVE